jgi:hypothetical protein
MEIDITDFFTTEYPGDYSNSVANLGQDAAKITWHAAMECEHSLIDTDDKRAALRAHVAEFGAWDSEEIADWTDNECNALFIQLVSGDMREACQSDEWDWEEYQEAVESGQASGNLFRGDDGRVYYYLGM